MTEAGLSKAIPILASLDMRARWTPAGPCSASRSGTPAVLAPDVRGLVRTAPIGAGNPDDLPRLFVSAGDAYVMGAVHSSGAVVEAQR